MKKVPDDWIRIHFKEYPRFDVIKLPRKFSKSKMNIEKSIEKRRSRRNFNGKPVSLRELSKLLYYSSGITFWDKDLNKTRRAYPSGGARYPLEVYLLVLKGSGIKQGLYHYNVKRHALEELLQGNYNKEFYYLYKGQGIKGISAVFIITSIISRSSVKYGELAKTFELLEAGHVGENIYLLSESMGLGCCAIGWYDKKGLNKLLDVDGEYESVVHLVAVGKI